MAAVLKLIPEGDKTQFAGWARATLFLMEAPTIRLALFEDLSQAETVAADPYGFNALKMHELSLYLGDSAFPLPTGPERGILCAVLTLPSLETKTAAYTVNTRSMCVRLTVTGVGVALVLKVETKTDAVSTGSLRTDLIVHDMRVVLPLGRV